MAPEPLLPFDEGAVKPGKEDRTENEHPQDTLARLPLRPPARRNAPHGTSRPTGDRIAEPARDLRARVLAHIVASGEYGSTDDEGETALTIKPQTYTPRRRELALLGLVRDSGRRRATESGRPAAVWVAATLAAAGPDLATAAAAEREAQCQ